MHISAKSALFMGTALSLGLPVVAMAQNSGAPMEEIIVTARRVEERLEKVPASITVFNQQQLTERNIATPNDLATFTPSLSFINQFGTEFSSVVIRGFGQDIGTSPTVGVYFADVVAPRGGFGGTTIHAGEGAGPGSFFDLENVQVLKGPQGTLFGRNTTGGAIILVPRKPTTQFEGYIEAGFGNYGMEHIQAVVNLPINEQFRLRAGFDQQTRDGYLTNISGIGPSNFGDIDYKAGRLSAIAEITDDIENYTVFSIVESDTNGIDASMVSCNPSFGITGVLACAQLAKEGSKRGPYTVDSPLFPAGTHLRQWQVANTTTWNATDDLTIKNIASYAEINAIDQSALFGDDLPLPGGTHIELTTEGVPLGVPLTDQLTFTEELQFQGKFLDDRLRWTGGLYWEGSHPLGLSGSSGMSTNDCANYQTFQCTPVFGPFSLVGVRTGTVTWRDYGIYFEDTYAITDEWKLTTGMRFTDDTTVGHTQRLAYAFSGPNMPVPQTAVPGVTGPGCETGITQPNCTVYMHQHSSAPTGRINLQYTPSDDLLVYAQYSRGYRAGGLLSTGPVDNEVFQAEEVDAYEIGMKNTFHEDISGVLNLAAFYNNFTNPQVEGTFVNTNPLATVQPNAGILNGGAARIWGFEIDSTVSPVNNLTVTFGYTYLNSKLQSAVSTVNSAVYNLFGPNVAVGGPLQLTPKNKFSIAPTYHLPLDESLGKISIGAVFTYTGSQEVYTGAQLGSAKNPLSDLPAVGLLSLNANWESVFQSPFDVEFFMTNAMDRHYSLYNSPYAGVFGWNAEEWAPPRMFGGRLRYHFGGESSEPAATAFTPPPVQAPASAPHSYLVFFDFDKSDLTPQATQIVDDAAKNAGPAHVTRITCTGHTDTVGSAAYNMRLSKRRAESVASELEKQGIPSSEIEIVAKGKADPLVPTADGVREPQNRRVQIVYEGGPTS